MDEVEEDKYMNTVELRNYMSVSKATLWRIVKTDDRMPKSYKVGERGVRLSGGQRQAIALARCLVRKPKILVLDEPTSSMDGSTEERIMNNLLSLPYNPTIIISTHRTNHLARVDKIGVLINGELVQYGPRDSILKQNTSNQGAG